MPIDTFIADITHQLKTDLTDKEKTRYLFRTEPRINQTALSETDVLGMPGSYEVVKGMGSDIYRKIAGTSEIVLLCPRILNVGGAQARVHVMYGVQTFVPSGKTASVQDGIIALVTSPTIKDMDGRKKAWDITPYAVAIVRNEIISAIGVSGDRYNESLRRRGEALVSLIGLELGQGLTIAIERIAETYVRATPSQVTFMDMRLPKPT